MRTGYMQAAPICIEYDDDATDIIVKINKALNITF